MTTQEQRTLVKHAALHRMKEFDATHEVRDGLVCRPKGMYPYGGKVFGIEEVGALMQEASRFWLTEGRHTTAFEAKVSEWMDDSPCVAVNSGSSANLLALAAVMQPDASPFTPARSGSVLITTALNFPTTVAPALQLGLQVVVVDVDPDTWNVDMDQLERAVEEYNPRVIMLAHTLGNPIEWEQVQDISRSRDCWLIEDTCDALGSMYGTLPCGSFGHLSTLSFYPPHQITTGEGGMVICNVEAMEGVVRSLRDWGRDCSCASGQNNRCGNRWGVVKGMLPAYDHKFIYARPGYNLRMTDLQAVVGNAQMERLAAFTDARRTNWDEMYGHLYMAKVTNKIGVMLRSSVTAQPAWFGFGLKVYSRPRTEVVQQLSARKIDTRHPFAGNIVRQPGFMDAGIQVCGDLVHTDEICTKGFFLGVYPGLNAADIAHVGAAVQEVLG